MCVIRFRSVTAFSPNRIGEYDSHYRIYTASTTAPSRTSVSLWCPLLGVDWGWCRATLREYEPRGWVGSGGYDPDSGDPGSAWVRR